MSAEEEILTDWEKEVKQILIGLRNDIKQMLRNQKEIIVRLKVMAEALEE